VGELDKNFDIGALRLFLPNEIDEARGLAGNKPAAASQQKRLSKGD